MEFKSKTELYKFLNANTIFLGSGSQGECYLDKKTKSVYKIFLSYTFDNIDDTYSKSDILKFSDIKTNTFIFASDIISVNDSVVGYISKYVNAKNLYKIDPLLISLDKFERSIESALCDVDIMTDKCIRIYDVPYNILYGKNLYVTDFDEFNYVDLDSKVLKDKNYNTFSLELYWFLVDGYFNKFVNDNSNLKELYESKKDILEFLKLFRKSLSEYVGHDIDKLSCCSKCRDKKLYPDVRYEREIKRF